MCLPPGKQPTVCLLSLSVCQRFWPSGQSHSTTYRPVSRTARTSGRHVPHIASLLPQTPTLVSTFPSFFFASTNYKHMRPCGSTDCCQTSRLLFLLSSALWHAGRFILPPPERSLSAAFRFVGGVLWRQLGKFDCEVRLERGNVTRTGLFLETFLSNLAFSHLTGRKSVSFSLMLNSPSIKLEW